MFTWIWYDARCNANDGDACSESVTYGRISSCQSRFISSNCFSASITETTTYEYNPHLPSRTVYENGEFKQVPPFARPREVELPAPYGKATQYIIPHSETITLAKALENKGVKLIETRGTWPKQNMQLVRALYDYGILRNDQVEINGEAIGIMDCVSKYLLQSKEGQETEVYGYALHVEVIGMKNNEKQRHVLYHTHPLSDGSVEGWEKLRAYTRNVGIPFGIATELIAKGDVNKVGVVTPEEAL